MPETNAANQVALRYYQPQNTVLVQRTPSGKDYVFVCRANITLAWVEPADVEHLLGRRKRCCGNASRQLFYYASADDVRRWTNGGGR